MKKKMKKYAMVAINGKVNENNEPVVRRVLIEYKKYIDNTFEKTRFILCDPYFYDNSRSHKYIFDDKGYILAGSSYSFDTYLIGAKRKYHYPHLTAKILGIDLQPILFEAADDITAIKTFKNRKELCD